MTSAIKCPECGTELPSNVPPNMCPQCLLKIGLGTQSDQEAGATSERMPLPGSHFGHYEINRLLGKGGMGAVYEAQDLNSGRRVALKVLSKALNSRKARERFLHEGQLAASINHKNCVYVFGTEEINEIPVISMELVNGGTLADLVQESGPLPSAKAVDAILEIIAGLEAAQAVGVLHRDIKPANCFRDADGSIKVGDFGLSISTAPQSAANLITGGSFAGTPAFSSPEQLRGEELSLRSDIYAVGVTLYYLLTGKVPFEASNAFQLIAKVLEKVPESPYKLRREIPSGLSKAAMRCLEKQPATRFANYKELRESLEPFCSIAPVPATFVSRVAAGLIDITLIAIIELPASLLIFKTYLPDFWVKAYFFDAGITIAYFGVLEGIWGASLGKHICGLRITRLNQSPPGIMRSIQRAAIFFIATSPPVWFSLDNGFAFAWFTIIATFPSWFSSLLLYVLSPFLLFALLFAMARRNNFYAGIHEIISQTRVVRNTRLNHSLNQTPKYDAKIMPESGALVGPYHVVEALRESPEEALFLCKDALLKRAVWVRKLPAGSPQIADGLHALCRPGRLRWISGHRSLEQSWDAYQAVPGNSFLKLQGSGQSWATVRVWLLDLVEEINAGMRDQSLPKVLKLDRVWIASDGHAKLLDFPAPAANLVKSNNAVEETGADSPQQFLINFAAAGFGGHIEKTVMAQPSRLAMPMPVHARQLLKHLEDGLDLDGFQKRLKSVQSKIAFVSRSRRLALFCCTVLILPLILFSPLLAIYAVDHYVQIHYKDLRALSVCLIELQRLQNDKSTNADLTVQCDQMQTYVAGYFRSTVLDFEKQSEELKTLAEAIGIITRNQFGLAKQIIAVQPNPTRAETHEAAKVVQPLLDKKLKPEPRPQISRSEFLIYCYFAFLFIALCITTPCILAAMLFRRGLVAIVFKVEVVKENGMRASRLHLVLRSVVAMFPFLFPLFPVLNRLKALTPFGIRVSLETAINLEISILAGLLVLTAVSLLLPKRSLLDRIARTWLVPR